jgi:HSP20 family protein
MMMYKRFRHPTLWREIDRFQDEMNSLFDARNDLFRGFNAFPAINVWTNSDGAKVQVEVPGVSLDDVQLSLVADTLTISGERKPHEDSSESTLLRQERLSGKFSRTLELPFPIESGKVEATLDNGILTISLPRAEDDKPRKIQIRNS